jgi:hypothetical protein
MFRVESFRHVAGFLELSSLFFALSEFLKLHGSMKAGALTKRFAQPHIRIIRHGTFAVILCVIHGQGGCGAPM